ncbi:MAG: hypothetical protein L0H70_01460, partial [Xanthomonadales bacterium]|nr:hypothetical protein [Xanthomonadales bacterium]
MATFWNSRPRWQSRDASVRRDAVTNDIDPALLPQLSTLAREDVDTGVRIAAVRRAADLALAQSCAQSDADGIVREAANTLFLALLDGSHPAAPALIERMKWLAGSNDRTLREHLARHAREPELREAALDDNVRSGLLTECILGDPDPALRLRLLARVSDADILQRLATQSRRRDKQVSQAASQRVLALRVAAGDTQAIRSCAEQCCQQLEQATGLDRAGRDQALSQAENLWQSLGAPADAALATRYLHASTQLEAINSAADAPASLAVTKPAEATPLREAEPLHASAPVTQTSVDAQRLVAEARFQADVAEGTLNAPVRPKPKPVLVDASKLLEDMEAALDQGDL